MKMSKGYVVCNKAPTTSDSNFEPVFTIAEFGIEKFLIPESRDPGVIKPLARKRKLNESTRNQSAAGAAKRYINLH